MQSMYVHDNYQNSEINGIIIFWIPYLHLLPVCRKKLENTGKQNEEKLRYLESHQWVLQILWLSALILKNNFVNEACFW